MQHRERQLTAVGPGVGAWENSWVLDADSQPVEALRWAGRTRSWGNDSGSASRSVVRPTSTEPSGRYPSTRKPGAHRPVDRHHTSTMLATGSWATAGSGRAGGGGGTGSDCGSAWSVVSSMCWACSAILRAVMSWPDIR